MPWQRSQAAPYGSVRAFLRFLREAAKHGWPEAVDHAFLAGMGLKGGSAWEVLVALRFFGLVDPATDRPGERYGLLLAPWPEGQGALARAIDNAYKEALDDVGWADRERGELESAFLRRYGKGIARRQAAFAVGIAAVLGLRKAPVERRSKWWGMEAKGERVEAAGSAGVVEREGEGGDERQPVETVLERRAAGERKEEAVALSPRELYVRVLLARLERADALEAERLARRIEALLGIERPGRGGPWRLLGILAPWRRRRTVADSAGGQGRRRI
ncbi:hypothetical protein HRbin24_00697 [bacterium HR24]|nr:hypothetical protein HRbin24_00697 [bacterium HR24]